MLAALEIQPTTNLELSDPMDALGDMEGLARALKGLGYGVQLIAAARATTEVYDWESPPRFVRRWLVVFTADSQTTLELKARLLAKTFGSIGLQCERVDVPELPVLTQDDITPDAVWDGENWCASLVMRRWPRNVAPGWLGQVLASMDDAPVDVGIHVHPQDAQKISQFLKSQQAWQAGSSDAGDELGREDAERVRKNLIARVDKPCSVAVVLTVRAPDRDTLKTRVETLQHEIGLTLADVRVARGEQDRGLYATLPSGRCDIIAAYRTLDCTSAASTWIFQPVTILHKNGAALGTAHGMVVKLDPFDESLRSFSGLLTGSVGSGKSYFLKLLLMHIDPKVEIRIVEHSDPPEYDGVPGLLTYSVAEMSESEQATKLRQYISDLWVLARSDPKPRLLVLDELWSVLKRPELADLVEEVARRGRKYGLALWIATQQVEELIESGKPVFDNAAIKVLLQQEDRDLEGLCKAAHLSDPARRVLRSAARGQALIQCGKMLVLVDIQATPEEHRLVTTDPREVWAAQAAA